MKAVKQFLIFALLTFTVLNAGCSVLIASKGNMPAQWNYDDGESRGIVEKDWGKPVESKAYFDPIVNASLSIDTYKIKYKRPNSYRAELWSACDLFTLALCELIATPLELFAFHENYRHNVFYYNDTVINKRFAYRSLVKALFYDTGAYKKNLKIVVLPFSGVLSQSVAEDFRFQFISTISRSFTNIRIIERSQIDAILKEHKFNMTLTNINDSITLGRLVGADYMVNVNCRQRDNSNFDTAAILINVETGEIEATANSVIW